MSTKFNTFRAQRYLRSRFVEGKFLLASEATDLELEILDLLRQQVRKLFGDAIAVEDAWKVERLNERQLLIKPGEAWVDGFPFDLRSGKDQLVSGALLSIGEVPAGVSIDDEPQGQGKILTFGTTSTPNNNGETTPTNNYRVVVTAREELITDIQDPFLKNVNLTESTAQKIRVVFQINIVPEAIQTKSPIPYRDESSGSVDSDLTPTNFPNTGLDEQPNFVNEIIVTPTDLGGGETRGALLNINTISGSEAIDGKNIELIISNPIDNNPIPRADSKQAAFSNGKLIDSEGTEYHINFVTNDAVGDQVRIVIDKEFQQLDPVIDAPGGRPYRLEKRNIYVTDDVNGDPKGKLHWPISTANWNVDYGFVHSSDITDRRIQVKAQDQLQDTLADKMDLFLVAGGNLSWDSTTSFLDWSAALKLVSPYNTSQTISATSIPLVDGGSLVYKMNLESGGAIERGTLVISSTSTGTTIALTGSPDLSNVRVGNIIVDDNGTVAAILDIDDVNDTLTVDTSMTFTSGGTIYLDSYAPQTAPKNLVNFVLAVREGSKVYVGINDLELESGETNQLGDGTSAQTLAYIGAVSEVDNDPNYTSINDLVQGSSLTVGLSRLDQTSGNMQTYTGAVDGDDTDPNYSSAQIVTQGGSLTQAVGELDSNLNNLNNEFQDLPWRDEVTTFSNLPTTDNKDGDTRLVLDTRIVYHWNSTESKWLPLPGLNSGIKVVGGGTVSHETAGQLAFSSNMFLEKAGLNYSENTISVLESPISLPNDRDVAYVNPNSIAGEPPLSVVVDTLDQVPPTAVIVARREDILIDSNQNSVYEQNDFSTGLNSLGTNTLVGLTFTAASNSSTVTTVAVALRADSSPEPTGPITAKIIGTSGTTPDDTNVIATSSTTFESADLTPTPEVVEFTFNNANLVAGTFYAVELDFTNLSSGSIAIQGANSDTRPSRVWRKVGTNPWQALSAKDPFIIVTETADVFKETLIVGSSSTRLAIGESTNLYGSITDQERNRIYGMKSGFFRSDELITWTGSELTVNSDIIYETLKDGGIEQSYTITAVGTIAVANGEYIFATIDRTVNTDSINFSVGLPPAEAPPGSEVIIFGKRQDIVGTGYLHIPFHKQVIEPGQTVRIGASGTGGLSGSPILETLKNRLLDSTFEAVTPQVFTESQDDLVDASSTGEFSLISRNFELDATETLVTKQMLDSSFKASQEFLNKTELLVFWDLDLLDTAATYEVSRNAGNEWQAITMERIDDTDLFRGFHTFTKEASNQVIDSQATSDSTEELNTSTQQKIGQTITITDKTEVREVDLNFTINDSGSLGGNVFVGLYSDNSGIPGTVLAETNAIPISSLTAGVNTINIPDTVLTVGTYHVVVRTDQAYKNTFSSGVDSIALAANSAGTGGSVNDGTTWTSASFSLVFELRGIEYDLRIRITASQTSALKGTGILYDEAIAGIATGITNREVVHFKAVADNFNEFTITSFVPNTDLLQVFYIQAGQVFTYPAFSVSGQVVQFEVDQFNNNGVEADVTLVFDQTRGGAFDNSDLNGLLLSSNHLGSTDPSIDKSSNGRGIFLRRPDGTLREITINNNDEIEIFSV